MRKLISIVFLLVAAPLSAAGDLHVTYLGNEGFLLEVEGRKVLIDALVGEHNQKAFVDRTAGTADKLRRGEAPYDDVDLVLATHVHGDHFYAFDVALHLVNNPKAVFVSTEQAVKELKRQFEGYAQIRDRVRVVNPEEGTFVELEELGLSVANLHHGRYEGQTTQNLGFLIEMGGHRLLHIGDTEATAEDFAPLELPSREIDVAFVPSWYFTDPWEGVIEPAVKPKNVIAMHLAPRWKDEKFSHNQIQSRKRVRYIREKYPDVILFEEYHQERIFAAVAD
jgi:L-ascorbate metabolism protein UlaG (beta-lactamase superfamily)